MFFVYKSSEKIHWTNHVKAKMRFYQLSEQRIRRVLNSPKRTEEGIAPNTVAMMQAAGSVKHPYEIWVMIQKINQKSRAPEQSSTRGAAKINSKIKIISAWKYPGITKSRGEIAFDFLQREYFEYADKGI